MPQTLEEKLADEKKRAQNEKIGTSLQNLKDAGFDMNGSDKREVSAYERAADTISKGLHTTENEKAVQEHTNLPNNVVAPVLEIDIIKESVCKENAIMKQLETVDSLTRQENDIIEKEIIEISKSIPIILASRDGFRSIQGVDNLRSLVSGEKMMRDGEEMGKAGILGKIKRAFVGGDK